jgi:hypothetical protein
MSLVIPVAAASVEPLAEASTGELVLAFLLFLPLRIILLILLAVVLDCAESSVSELEEDDEVSELDDELKYWAAGPGWVSLSMISRGVDSYMYEWELSWKTRYKM